MIDQLGPSSFADFEDDFRCKDAEREERKAEKEESGLSMGVGLDETALMRCLLQDAAVGWVAFELMSGWVVCLWLGQTQINVGAT